MAIFLCVLKWILIILLCIVALILFVAAAVLFIPVRYKVEGEYGENTDYGFSVHWLFHLITMKKKMGSNTIRFTILCIPFGRPKKKKKTKPSNEKTTEVVIKQPEKAETNAESSRPTTNQENDKVKTQKSKKVKQKKKKKEKSFSFSKISSIIKFIREKATHDTIRMLKKELMIVIRHVVPRKVKGYVHFGTGDPATTGIVLGIISLFPFAYQKGFQVLPDFEDEVLEAKGWMKGRARVITILLVAFRLYRNKELKGLINRYNKLKEDLSYGRQ